MEIKQVKAVESEPAGSQANPVLNVGLTSEQSVLTKNPSVVKKMESNKDKSVIISTVVLAMVLGIGSGMGLYNSDIFASNSNATEEQITENENIDVDESMLQEQVFGTLNEGGVNGEGTHHIETEQGKVALLSTSIYLDPFAGKQVTVWGLSVGSPNVDWLIDVAKIKVQ